MRGIKIIYPKIQNIQTYSFGDNRAIKPLIRGINESSIKVACNKILFLLILNSKIKVDKAIIAKVKRTIIQPSSMLKIIIKTSTK